MKNNLHLWLLAIMALALSLSGCYAQSCPAPETLESAAEIYDSQNESLDTSGALSLSDMKEMQLYENAEYSFSISYPTGWTAEEPDPNELGIVAGFLAPGDNIDNPQNYVMLQIEELPAGMNLTLAQYGQAALSSLKAALPDLHIEAESDISMGEQTGHAIVYNLESDGAEYRVLKAWTVHGDEAYIFTYNAPVDRFDEFAKDASTIISSLVVA